MNRRAFIRTQVLIAAGILTARRMAFAADPVDPDRLPDGGTWHGRTGVRDVDPTTRTKSGSTLPSSSSASDINTAISGAAANTYVELDSGVVTLGGDIIFNTARKTLRGQVDANGVPTTILRFTSADSHVKMFTDDDWDFGNSGGWTTRTVASGHTRGSSTVTLTAAPTGLTAGRLMWFSAPTSAPDIDGDGAFTDTFDGYPFTMAVLVTGVSGNDVTFTPSINPAYLSGLTIKVHYRTADKQLDYCGIENCIIEVGTTGYFNNRCIEVYGVNQCWIKNCHLKRMGGVANPRAHIFGYCVYGLEVYKCRISGAQTTEGNSSQYGIVGQHMSGLKIYHNRFTDCANVWPMLTTSGSAFAYNYCYDMNYGAFQSQWVFDHGGANHFNLLEGNWIGGSHIMDGPTTGGNPSHSNACVIFRERIVGYDQAGGATTNLNCIQYKNEGSHRKLTIAGCVLGSSPPVQDAVTGGGGGNQGEGEGYIYNMSAGTTAETDFLSNYNTVTGGIPAGEQLGGGDALVDSYLFPSKPDFFGDRPWPWCTPSDFSQSNDPENLPAGYLEINGEDPPGSGGGSSGGGTVNVNALRIGTIQVAP